MSEALYGITFLALLVFYLAGLWKSFEKAGVDGWRALIPLYNAYLVIKISDMSGWWIAGFLAPIVNVPVTIYMNYRFARNYGKGALMSLLTGLLPILMVPVLGFGSSDYMGNYAFSEDSLA